MFTYHQTTTDYSCGVDLHSRQMYIYVMDRDGKALVHRNVRGNDLACFLKLVEPYKHSLTVCCECTFNWYWFADACQDARFEFVLGHALYMRAIHSFKTKNDRQDCFQIAHLLRSNLIPPAYVYPRERRSVRALLRQRTTFLWKRSEILTRMSMGVMADGHSPLNSNNRPRDKWVKELRALYSNSIEFLNLLLQSLFLHDPGGDGQLVQLSVVPTNLLHFAPKGSRLRLKLNDSIIQFATGDAQLTIWV